MQTITIAPPKRSWFSLLSWAIVLAVLVVSWQGAEMAPLTLIKDGGNMATFAGVLALFIHTTGVLSKLLSEAVEAIEPGPVEGIRATGANKLEEILYGVLPQVMPLLISYSLYRFESNVRSATVVGMVGAGGIGVTLWEAIRGFQFQQTCALMVLIIVTVSLLDFLSQRLRKHFI
ncbi:TPA: ABC transporter permease subunit [Escherichia coli]|nr:ABC transporter permease subunit [Escherichia coli]HBB9446696.1 ABC transporter permease subunit [Escherichia coli]HBK0978141.1 ABC transporter permease subunit [Escherichia coli]